MFRGNAERPCWDRVEDGSPRPLLHHRIREPTGAAQRRDCQFVVIGGQGDDGVWPSERHTFNWSAARWAAPQRALAGVGQAAAQRAQVLALLSLRGDYHDRECAVLDSDRLVRPRRALVGYSNAVGKAVNPGVCASRLPVFS